MRPLAKCEFIFCFSPDSESCGYLCGAPGENIGHFLLIFLENAHVLALSRDDNENVLRHQPFCAITFPLIGMPRFLSSTAWCHPSVRVYYGAAVTSHTEMICRGKTAARRQCGPQ